MAGYLGLLLSSIVFVATGRIVLGCIPGNHATKINLLVSFAGAFFSAMISFALVFAVAAVLGISLQPRDENTLTFLSWMIGGIIGGSLAAWLTTRLPPPRKGVPE